MAKRTLTSELAVMSHAEVAEKLFRETGKRLSRARIGQLEQVALKKMAKEALRLGLDPESQRE